MGADTGDRLLSKARTPAWLEWGGDVTSTVTLQKSVQRPPNSQSPQRVGSGRFGPPISAGGGVAEAGTAGAGAGDRGGSAEISIRP